MYTTVIDTLRFADRLKAAGFDDPKAEGMARALGDEMAGNLATKRDLTDAVRAINATVMAMDAKFESKFDALEPRFDAIDIKLESQHREFFGRSDSLEPRFDAIDIKLESHYREFSGRFDALEPRFDAIDAKLESHYREFSGRFDALEPRFDAIDVKLESQYREFSSKFNLLFGTMALGFTLVIGLIGYSLFSPRSAEPVASAVERHTAEVRLQ